MRLIPPFDPSQATTHPYVDIGAANVNCKMLLYNESPYNIDLNFDNGNTSTLHAWEARYWTLDADTRQVGWKINTALAVTGPPISLVMGELYNEYEKVEGSYPMALIRQASVGGTVTTSAGATLSNSGNSSGSNVVSVSSTAAPGNTWTLTNDGLFHLLVTIAGALVNAINTQEVDPILQLGAAAHMVEVLGNLTVDGTATVTGQLTATANANSIIAMANKLAGGAANIPSGLLSQTNIADIIDASSGTDTYYKARSGAGHLQQDVNGDILTWDGNGIHVKRGAVNLVNGTVRRMTGGHVSSISGVTVTHGLGVTPIVVLVCVDIVQAGSGTIGAGNIGATTFQCTGGAGAGLWWQTWQN